MAVKKRKKSRFLNVFAFLIKIGNNFFIVSIGSVILFKWVNPLITLLMVIRLFQQNNDKKLRWNTHG